MLRRVGPSSGHPIMRDNDAQTAHRTSQECENVPVMRVSLGYNLGVLTVVDQTSTLLTRLFPFNNPGGE